MYFTAIHLPKRNGIFNQVKKLMCKHANPKNDMEKR